MNIQIVKPQPGPQAAFIQCTADVVCYGGARGGGKSWAIALDFWLHAERHGEDARGLILRKTREDLKDFIDTAGHMYAGSARYLEKGNFFRFTSGAKLYCGYLEREADAANYQGWSLTRLYFDELTQLTILDPVLRLLATLRSAKGIRPQAKFSCNPGGPSHHEVKSKFVDLGAYNVTWRDGLSWVFIPASGVLVDTIAAIMKDYAVTPEAEVFTQRKYSGHPQEIASLAGARMCSVSEVDEGAQWNIRLLKDVTGGGKIAAHFMRQNQFEFFPEFKLTISGNHQPTFPGGITPAVRRRFHMLNFLFTPTNKNKNLKDELLADEAHGILRWMIDGCLLWQRRGKKGIVIPKKVRTATDAFLHDEDLLARWIEAETRKVPGTSTPSREAFRRWCEWRNAQGNSNLFDTNRSFSLEMQNKGWAAKHTKTGNVFADLELLERENSF